MEDDNLEHGDGNGEDNILLFFFVVVGVVLYCLGLIDFVINIV